VLGCWPHKRSHGNAGGSDKGTDCNRGSGGDRTASCWSVVCGVVWRCRKSEDSGGDLTVSPGVPPMIAGGISQRWSRCLSTTGTRGTQVQPGANKSEAVNSSGSGMSNALRETYRAPLGWVGVGEQVYDERRGVPKFVGPRIWEANMGHGRKRPRKRTMWVDHLKISHRNPFVGNCWQACG